MWISRERESRSSDGLAFGSESIYWISGRGSHWPGRCVRCTVATWAGAATNRAGARFRHSRHGCIIKSPYVTFSCRSLLHLRHETNRLTLSPISDSHFRLRPGGKVSQRSDGSSNHVRLPIPPNTKWLTRLLKAALKVRIVMSTSRRK